LPADFPASIFIVQHIPPHSPSLLPQLLCKAGPVKAVHPADGDRIESNRIYVAPPDHHLLLENGKVVVKRGPKENRFRPSIDALFRSAAYVYGPRVIGIVLSGALDDGTSGLWTIKRLGGLAIVQDAEDAAFPEMPINVTEYVKVDHIARMAQMPELLIKLTAERAPRVRELSKKERKRLEIEIQIATHDNAFEMGIIEMGTLTAFTCPECNGALTRLDEGDITRFRCHTGHAFTINALLSGVSEAVEDQLWQAMRSLEESNLLLNEMAKRFSETKRSDIAAIFTRRAAKVKQQAQIVHDSVLKQKLVSGDLRFEKPVRAERPSKRNRARRIA
jgi:two-component system chemotaxis response regulator CheB